MDTTNGKISLLQAFMILMLMNGLTNHVIVNPMILDASGRDSWISAIMAAALFLPWCLILFFIMKRSGQQKLQPWLASQTNTVISWILISPVILQLYMIGSTTVIHTSIWTVTNYLPATPKFILTGALTFVCFYSAIMGVRAIAICSGILLPAVIALGIFVAIANSPEKDYRLLKPFLENGLQPAINGMVFAGGGFVELITILLMQHHIKNKIKVWKLLIFAALMVYITIGPLIGGIVEFGPEEAAKQMISPYEQWRLVRLGDYVEHVDFLSVFQWLSGACIRISLSLFLLADIIPTKSSKVRNLFNFIVSLSYVVTSFFPINQNEYYLWMYHDYFPMFLIVTVITSVVWGGVSLIKRSKKEEAT
ncbi:GerAB/ArcD/ProY family transporter [Paenibacillus sp. UNC451MF]|uniref:GerAB/ArcD/ProY family transporter n=1 Tax=Paenibacillus sp. UNC451MF TaxID=1449063 RepID=UPI00048D0575|nr:endospore germination permease [Paenibacillus sp. UNC451MF]